MEVLVPAAMREAVDAWVDGSASKAVKGLGSPADKAEMAAAGNAVHVRAVGEITHAIRAAARRQGRKPYCLLNPGSASSLGVTPREQRPILNI